MLDERFTVWLTEFLKRHSAVAGTVHVVDGDHLAIKAAARRVRAADRKVATAQLMHLNPFPANLGEVLARYPKVLVPEMNLGQLSRLVRAEFLVDAQSLNKVQGLPFRAAEIESKMTEMIDG